MNVIYKRELTMSSGEKAHFILGKVYKAEQDCSEFCIQNERNCSHYMNKDFMLLHFDVVSVAKPMTVSVAHQIAAFDAELAHMQAQYEIDHEATEAAILRMREALSQQRTNIAERMEEYQALLTEYGVEEN